jgi:hypothetical protein
MGGSRAADSGDGTPRRTTTDAMAQGGRCTCGHPRDEGLVMGGRHSDGNASKRTERRQRNEGEVTVRLAIVGQQREDWTEQLEAALAGCSRHDLARITLAVGIGRSRVGFGGR